MTRKVCFKRKGTDGRLIDAKKLVYFYESFNKFNKFFFKFTFTQFT